MKSLFDLTIKYIIDNPRRSLKKLPSFLREIINISWINQELTSEEKLYEGFELMRFRESFTHLVSQDIGIRSPAILKFAFLVPTHKTTANSIKRRGFIYNKLLNDSHLRIYYVDSIEYKNTDQNQVRIELLPSKSQIRGLQGLLLPLVIPYFNHKSKELDLEFYGYYFNDECPDNITQKKGKVQNHWAHFFDINDW